MITKPLKGDVRPILSHCNGLGNKHEQGSGWLPRLVRNYIVTGKDIKEWNF